MYKNQSKVFSSLIDNKFFIDYNSMWTKYNVTEQERKNAIRSSSAPNHIPIEKHTEALDYIRSKIDNE